MITGEIPRAERIAKLLKEHPAVTRLMQFVTSQVIELKQHDVK